MKQTTCYQCELCWEIYPDKQEAESCEKNHVINERLSIMDAKHDKELGGYGYPSLMLVEISDYSGVLAEYSLIRQGSCKEFEPYHKPIDEEIF